MDVLGWLLDSDPAIRWQVMQDLMDAPADEVQAERARVSTDGWGGRLLSMQGADGQWDGGTYRPAWADDSKPFFDAWTATHFVLQSLREFGLDPRSEQARRAVGLVRENARWDYNGEPYFDGEAEPCINGIALASGAYFGEDAARIVERLLAVHLRDGGWNCWAEHGDAVSSFHSTICSIEGLLEWERARGVDAAVADARRAGEEYLLERALFRRRSTGEVADPRFLMLSDPTRWFYDILRGLDHFRIARPERDDRCAEAIEVLRAKQRPRGYWMLENTHAGATHFDFDQAEGFPSRWITLRALRVLRWWDGSGPIRAAGE
ncbi:hypothetical protein ACLQ2Q_01690 [Microbacterium sp. DT81.1]|uniref:hypothetical protein n=1 Tax=Microbacterium sp. DT81.1 TaxID=3393413 RepID=UPI003CEE791F